MRTKILYITIPYHTTPYDESDQSSTYILVNAKRLKKSCICTELLLRALEKKKNGRKKNATNTPYPIGMVICENIFVSNIFTGLCSTNVSHP